MAVDQPPLTRQQYEQLFRDYEQHLRRINAQTGPLSPKDTDFIEALYQGANLTPRALLHNLLDIYVKFWRAAGSLYTPELSRIVGGLSDPFTPRQAYAIPMMAVNQVRTGTAAADNLAAINGATFSGRPYWVSEAMAFGEQAIRQLVRQIGRTTAGEHLTIAPTANLSGPLARRWAVEHGLCQGDDQPYFILVGEPSPKDFLDDYNVTFGLLWHGNTPVAAVSWADTTWRVTHRWKTTLPTALVWATNHLLAELAAPPLGRDERLARVDEKDMPPSLEDLVRAMQSGGREKHPGSRNLEDDYDALLPPFYGAYVEPCDLMAAIVTRTTKSGPIADALYGRLPQRTSSTGSRSLAALAARSYRGSDRIPLSQLPVPLEAKRLIASHQWRIACHTPRQSLWGYDINTAPERSTWEQLIEIALASGIDPGQPIYDPRTGLLTGTDAYTNRSALCYDTGIALSSEPFVLQNI